MLLALPDAAEFAVGSVGCNAAPAITGSLPRSELEAAGGWALPAAEDEMSVSVNATAGVER